MNRNFWLVCAIVLGAASCGKKPDTIAVQSESITRAVYASGIVKSAGQYQVFSNIGGIISRWFVKEGDTIREGQPLLELANEAPRLNAELARINAESSSREANAARLDEMRNQVALARLRLSNDSLMLARQQRLWNNQIGTRADLDMRQLAYDQSLKNLDAAKARLLDLQRQTAFAEARGNAGLALSRSAEGDLIIKSKVNGRLFSILREPGEFIGTQTPLAVAGDTKAWMLELQIDEYDVVKVRPGMDVSVRLDSYKDSVFTAKLNRIYPIMNERSRTFTAEAFFDRAPPQLYPNLNVEANIVLETRNKVLTIPREYLSEQGEVVMEDGSRVKVQTGLMDYRKVEIVSGLKEGDKLIRP
jgi:multidrug efflux pump subunit AcrA (membrane-fusion protein)